MFVTHRHTAAPAPQTTAIADTDGNSPQRMIPGKKKEHPSQDALCAQDESRTRTG